MEWNGRHYSNPRVHFMLLNDHRKFYERQITFQTECPILFLHMKGFFF